MSKDVENQIKAYSNEIKILEEKKNHLQTMINKIKKKKEKLEFEFNLAKSSNLDCDWGNESFDWDGKVLNILQSVFHLREFRLQQKAAINLILSKHCVLLLMPTGGGKSLCYQLPAIYSPGVTIVISPLLSLMEDQVITLSKLNITAYAMSSQTTKEDKDMIFKFLNKNIGDIKIIYVTPEWLNKSKRFLSALQTCFSNNKLERIAVDEVHCCSQWGHDFRPDYQFLSMLKLLFPSVPIIGLTATASNNVLLDIQKMLHIEGSPILRAPFDRPNLKFRVMQKFADFEQCMDYFYDCITDSYENMSGIIYTVTINDAIDIAKSLKEKGVKVFYYHAEMDKEMRLKVHRKWLENHYQVVVATVAFGMGIDKPDVKFVIHYSVPKSMESLYQEAGRAGRNGEEADCIVMFKLADYMKQSGYAKSSTQIDNCSNILSYSLNLSEHYLIQKHFESNTKVYNCDRMCDNCTSSLPVDSYDVSKACKQIEMIISRSEDNLTLLKLIDKWYKVLNNKSGIDKNQMAQIIGNLLLRGFLKEYRSYTAYSVNCYIKLCDKKYDDIIVKLVKDKKLDIYFKNDQSSDFDINETKPKKKRIH